MELITLLTKLNMLMNYFHNTLIQKLNQAASKELDYQEKNPQLLYVSDIPVTMTNQQFLHHLNY